MQEVKDIFKILCSLINLNLNCLLCYVYILLYIILKYYLKYKKLFSLKEIKVNIKE